MTERSASRCSVFPFGLSGDPAVDRLNYMSNADRRDMLTAMKEFIARSEGRHAEEQPAGAPKTAQ